MKNIELNTTKGEKAIVNWDNVCSVTAPEQYFCEEVYNQINFTNKEHLYVKDTMEDIKAKVDE